LSHRHCSAAVSPAGHAFVTPLDLCNYKTHPWLAQWLLNSTLLESIISGYFQHQQYIELIFQLTANGDGRIIYTTPSQHPVSTKRITHVYDPRSNRSSQ
jgi:hypothetical protein